MTTLVVPGADPTWSAGLHGPILEALERLDTDAVVAALEQHFDEVRDNLAARLPADERDPIPTPELIRIEPAR